MILAGKVKVYLIDENGKELVLEVKGPGEYFGETMLDEGPRPASAVTIEPCQFAIVSGADFRKLLTEHPDIALSVIQNLIQATRGLTENVRSLAMDVYGRVSRMLLALAVERRGNFVIPEKLTQQEIANRVGTSREVINRILRDLSIGGYIGVKEGTITINKPLPSRWQATIGSGEPGFLFRAAAKQAGAARKASEVSTSLNQGRGLLGNRGVLAVISKINS